MSFGYSLCLRRNMDPGCKHGSGDHSGVLWDVYYGSLKMLCYIWIVVACRSPTIAYCPGHRRMSGFPSVYVIGHVSC